MPFSARFFFLACVHSVLKRMQNAIILIFFHVFSSHLTKVKIAHKNVDFDNFFQTSMQKVSHNTSKCINFETVFVRVFHAFTKVKIAHKNTVFNTFFKTFIQEGFCPCYAPINQSENSS